MVLADQPAFVPGISLVNGRNVDRDAVGAALGSVRFFEDDETTVVHDGDRTTVAHSGYDDYPVRVVETEDATVCFEGRLYDVVDVESEVREVGTHLLADRHEPVADWMGSRDGDYLLVAVDRETGRTKAMVDSYARLPVYVATVGNATVLARELKFVREYADAAGSPLSFDDLAVAQTLTFGYRLGTRTLFEGVRRLPPGSVATVDDGATLERLRGIDVGDDPQASRSLEENAAQLANLFVEACRNRAASADETIVGLSGGLDSRAVAAGFAEAGTDVRAATFDLPDGGKADEVRAARAVADELGIDWESFVASEADRHRTRLLETKQGMNYLRLSFLLDFFEELAPARGDVTYVSGDGGDKALPDLSPGRSVGTEAKLVEYLLSANALFDPSEAARIAGVDRERLVASVRDRLDAYPEADPASKYVHFLVRERGMNWLFQGEDRNRYYYWTVTPFYARPFFEYAMGIPPEQKAGGALRRRFLFELAPELLDVEYANYGAPVNSKRYRAKRAAYDLLDRYPSVENAVVGVVSALKSDTMGDERQLGREIRWEVDERERVGDAVDPTEARRVAGDPASYSARELYHLLTLTSLPGTD